MAVTGMWGFEAGEVGTDSFSLNGTSSYSTGTVRTGARSVRCNPASGATGYASVLGTLATYKHFGLYIATLPSADRSICGVNDTPTWVSYSRVRASSTCTATVCS